MIRVYLYRQDDTHLCERVVSDPDRVNFRDLTTYKLPRIVPHALSPDHCTMKRSQASSPEAHKSKKAKMTIEPDVVPSNNDAMDTSSAAAEGTWTKVEKKKNKADSKRTGFVKQGREGNQGIVQADTPGGDEWTKVEKRKGKKVAKTEAKNDVSRSFPACPDPWLMVFTVESTTLHVLERGYCQAKARCRDRRHSRIGFAHRCGRASAKLAASRGE